MTTLLTGSSGFVGTAIAQQCQLAHIPIRKTDRTAPTQDGTIQANILDPASLCSAMQGVTCVIHAAGLAHQFGKRQTTAPFMAINADGTENVARAAANAGVQHVILISSVSVYGTHSTQACTEETPCHPEGIYAESKYQAEQRAIAIAQQTGMRLSILRLATVYGEGDPGNVARLIRTIDNKRFIWVGTGSNYKSLIHRDDVARACIAVATSSGNGIATYNISAPPCTMCEVVNEIAKSLQRQLPQWHIPALPILRFSEIASAMTDNHRYTKRIHTTIHKWLADDVYDGRKFEQDYHFHTTVSIQEGMQREVAWYNTTKHQ